MTFKVTVLFILLLFSCSLEIIKNLLDKWRSVNFIKEDFYSATFFAAFGNLGGTKTFFLENVTLLNNDYTCVCPDSFRTKRLVGIPFLSESNASWYLKPTTTSLPSILLLSAVVWILTVYCYLTYICSDDQQNIKLPLMFQLHATF